MYGALWRVLPGPVWLRIIEVLILLFVVLAILAIWVFPWVQELIPAPDVTVNRR
jgi:hypothetical protein